MGSRGRIEGRSIRAASAAADRRRGPRAGKDASATWKADVTGELARLRRRTLDIVEPLSEEVLGRQVCDFLSPLSWDLGHLASFEELWLVKRVRGASAGLEVAYDALETPRSQRAELPLPSKSAVLARLDAVRWETLEVLATIDGDETDPLLRDGYVYWMVIQHEAQHQETMLQSLDLGDDGPLLPTGEDRSAAPPAVPGPLDECARVQVPGGELRMGTTDRSRAYDNEHPAHAVEVGDFAIDRYPASNRRWLDFIDDGGYNRRGLWSEAGRRWLEKSPDRHPQGWVETPDGWQLRRFGRLRPVEAAEPVQHICYWEAEAFARWCGGRLPDEAEWEKAATDSSCGVEQLLGSVYQWTRSALAPYPGFEPFPYPEYSQVFFGDTYRVLRGSSWAADPVLWRLTYRNWDLPQRRQIFAGVRVAYEAG
jgi:iron(II)-dependent oxidoreductase